jgi:IS4 transposase
LVKWRLHTHFEVDRYVPTRIDVTPDGGGEHDERAVLERTIERDRLYVMDRGYAKFALFNAIVAGGSSYVCRLRDNSAYEVVESRALTEADRAAGVLSDQIVLIGQSGKAGTRPDHKIRLVCVKCSPHTSRGKYKGSSTGPDSDGVLRIATNLLDVPAEIIALLYAERWAIEIFFRFFKHLLGCRHLLSHSQNGIEIQTYCAIIACLLISLWTGRKPTKRTYEMICFYFCGLASEDELLAHLAKLKRQDEAASKKL